MDSISRFRAPVCCRGREKIITTRAATTSRSSTLTSTVTSTATSSATATATSTATSLVIAERSTETTEASEVRATETSTATASATSTATRTATSLLILTPPSVTTPSEDSSGTSSSGSGGLGTGAIVGIAVGLVVVLAIGLAIGLAMKKSRQTPEPSKASATAHHDNAAFNAADVASINPMYSDVGPAPIKYDELYDAKAVTVGDPTYDDIAQNLTISTTTGDDGGAAEMEASYLDVAAFSAEA